MRGDDSDKCSGPRESGLMRRGLNSRLGIYSQFWWGTGGSSSGGGGPPEAGGAEPGGGGGVVIGRL